MYKLNKKNKTKTTIFTGDLHLWNKSFIQSEQSFSGSKAETKKGKHDHMYYFVLYNFAQIVFQIIFSFLKSYLLNLV